MQQMQEGQEKAQKEQEGMQGKALLFGKKNRSVQIVAFIFDFQKMFNRHIFHLFHSKIPLSTASTGKFLRKC